MKLDIVYVSYNSEKWIEQNFTSYLKSNYDLKNVHIIVVDNGSIDRTLDYLRQASEKLQGIVGTFDIIESKENLGFGKANNLGFTKGDSEYVSFLNIDTELLPDTISQLMEEINRSNDEFDMWELRQFPYEHPKMYDPLTGETSWSSGAAFAVRRSIYEKVHGFDDNIFMYAEDVDLSWRIRSFGHRIKYVPKACIKHYAYENAGEVKPTQYVNSILNNLLLRQRFGTMKDMEEGELLYRKCLLNPEPYAGSREQLKKKRKENQKLLSTFRDKTKVGKDERFQPTFEGFDYASRRLGDFYRCETMEEYPLVSVIVRTCGRPSVLKETLVSLRNQTYPNMEVVVVEDGAANADYMIRKEFADLNIIYQATEKKVGRSQAGNLAMDLANGKYLNFLDDDDLFYADHIETLVRELQKTKNQAAYALAFETPIEILSKEPYEYKIYGYKTVHAQRFDKAILCHHNYIPIQCIMFEKQLFIDYGGLDVSLDALEDWDLWVRYACHTDFTYVEKTTSIYRVPKDNTINKKRQDDLDQTLAIVRKKHEGYMMQISVAELLRVSEASTEIIRVSNLRVVWWNVKKIIKLLIR